MRGDASFGDIVLKHRLGLILAALALPLPMAAPALAAPKTVATLDRWQVRIDPQDAAAAREHPQAATWLAATVPGSVQQDLIAAKIVPDPYKGANEAPIQWAGLTGWQYRTTLDVTPEMLRRDHLDLVFDGLDTFATVSVNGQPLLSADNAHRRWRADAKPLLKAGANEIVVTFASPIKTLQPMVLAEKHPLPGEYDSPYGDEPKGVQTSPYIRKPKYQYGWDWAPRIVDIGIWRPARLEAWDAARIDNLRIEQEALTDAEARILARASVVADRAQTGRMDVTVTGPDGKRIRVRRDVALQPGENDVVVPVSIAKPQRWQPVGFGAHPLYTVNAALAGADTVEKRTGLRTVELVRKDGSFGLKVNGNIIFAKGSNVIPFDAFPARVAATTERQMLEKAVAANMNIVRIWGGGYYPEHSFYDAADELGLMVWQDFMFGGAVTPPDAKFRDNVRIEAEEQVARLQSHPSLVIWAGNNEVLSGWENWSDRKAFKKAVGADEQERIGTGMAVLFDRVLRDAVVKNSPGIPYWPGSPSTDYEGPTDTDKNGDRHFWDVWSGSKPVERYTDSCPRFMSEYGFQAFPDLSTIATFADPADFRIDSPVMKAHQKFLSGEGNDRITFYLKQNLRDPRDFADLVYLSQAMQARAIGLAARHHRACRPVTLGSLYWQLNDSWPAISWSSIDWTGHDKMLQHEARRFFAPQTIVAETKPGATRIALISDATTPKPLGWRVTGYAMDGRKLGSQSGSVTMAAASASDVATIPDATLFAGAAPEASYAVAELFDGDKVIARQIVERKVPRDMTYPAPGITPRWAGKQLTLTARNLARQVQVNFGTTPAEPSDDGFDLLPGESITLTIQSDADAATLARELKIYTLGPKDAQ